LGGQFHHAHAHQILKVAGLRTSLKRQAKHLAQRPTAIDQQQHGPVPLAQGARTATQLVQAELSLHGCRGRCHQGDSEGWVQARTTSVNLSRDLLIASVRSTPEAIGSISLFAGSLSSNRCGRT
jgi:hypothetical protein